MKKLIKEIDGIVNYVTKDEKQSYEDLNERLARYLKGETDLSYKYFVNEKVGYRVVQEDIASALSRKFDEFAIYARDFYSNKDEDSFNKLINIYYIQLLAVTSALFMKKKLPAFLDSNISSLGLLSFAFFKKEEQLNVMKYLRFFLENKINEAKSKGNENLARCEAGHSILPLFIVVGNDFFQIEKDLIPFKDLFDGNGVSLSEEVTENFNEVYGFAYNNFLSDDAEVVNKVFTSLGDFHAENCRKDSKKFYVFDATEWQFLPSEILCLLKIRVNAGKDIDFVSHPTIDIFKPFIKKGDFTLTSENIKFRDVIYKNLLN
ncbi:hypothetical protein ACM92K_003333 [Cronobacter turicensis]|uniref:hypothetical protein n=1 Tax=Cronobacter TaxID=413496 RepID=UPI0013E9CC8B|nr:MULTISPECIES: hypothetical protein [unclassified Cronobacter]KAF6591663.1 hypothetical protein G9G39_20650 [Cronobacter sp. EKM101R]KAF6594017.1 hypothetical protein G9G38_19705 [Cronobacter sp. EKM102R]